MPRRCAAAAPRILAVLFLAAAVASGEVLDTADNGFTIRETVTLSVPPDKAYAAMIEVGRWWSPDHTYSGDSANLTIDPKPGGCWCEKLPSQGGVRHMTVTSVWPEKMIRFEGGLGRLQAMGVAGSMTWKFTPAEKGTAVEVRYAVGGYNPGGLRTLAPAVDGVLHEQVDRFRRFAETGKP